jgi:hypothetical protein
VIKINLIKKQDMETLVYKKMPWDVTVGKKPYQVIKVEGYVHTIGGRGNRQKGLVEIRARSDHTLLQRSGSSNHRA